MNKKILIIEDEAKIADIIKIYLEKDDYEVSVAYTGGEALEIFDLIKPSLIILDLMLPDISGEELCRKFREKSNCYIIILSAKSKEEQVIHGLEIGADDYIRKPFSPNELLYKIRSVYRREEQSLDEDIYLANGIVINVNKKEIKKDNEDIKLTKNEYLIFSLFLKSPNSVFSREEIIELVFNGDYLAFDRTIDSYIKNIRKKLGYYVIETVHGFGYKLGVQINEVKK